MRESTLSTHLIELNLCVLLPKRRKSTVSLETKTFIHLWRCERLMCADVSVLTVFLSLFFSVNQHSFVLISVYFHSWKQILGSVSRPAISSPRSKRLHASSLRKLGQVQKKEWRGRGRAEKENLFPWSSPFNLLFLSLSLQISHNNSIGNACYVG